MQCRIKEAFQINPHPSVTGESQWAHTIQQFLVWAVCE